MPDPVENISLPQSGDPADFDCTPGTQFTWTNNTGAEIISFRLPSCVKPPDDPAPIAAGATTRTYTVNGDAKGTYDYDYMVGDEVDPRDGVIDVGN